MLFKNAIAYTATSPLPLIAAKALDAFRFAPCGAHEQSRHGFIDPQGFNEMAPVVTGYKLICLQTEEKVIPSSAINKLLQEKVDEIEAKENRKVFRKEKQGIKDDLLHEMLPRAFTKTSRTHAIIKDDLIIIDSGNHTKAEVFLKHLREALGSLPVVPLQAHQSPAIVMTVEWLAGDTLPAMFELGAGCNLAEPGEGGSRHACKNQDLLGEEIKAHLNAGKMVTAIALNFDDVVRFTLCDDLKMKGLKFSEELIAEAENSSDGDQAALAASNLILTGNALVRLIGAITDAFGGEKGAAE